MPTSHETRSAPPATAPSTRERRRARRATAFSRGDRIALLLMVGVPTLLHVGLVWVPALASV
ncbi:MAG TPA: hypothetical protein VIL00_13160, partial [Pseudonocardiaceae bacterium]